MSKCNFFFVIWRLHLSIGPNFEPRSTFKFEFDTRARLKPFSEFSKLDVKSILSLRTCVHSEKYYILISLFAESQIIHRHFVEISFSFDFIFEALPKRIFRVCVCVHCPQHFKPNEKEEETAVIISLSPCLSL